MMYGRFGMASTLFPLLLAALLVGITYWLDLASRQTTGSSAGKLRHDPDYIVEDFLVRRYGPQGNLQHTLRAAHMQHFPDDDTTHVREPQLSYHSSPPTQITARTAIVNHDATHVQLIDDVRVTRGSSAGKPESVLLTRRLDTYPDEEIARTREAVTITQGRTRVTGVGLDANNQTGVYVLDGPVRGIFHRQPTTTKAKF
jgi:lipopolysaccharide export system protein LptC